jgi:hypothetical protein
MTFKEASELREKNYDLEHQLRAVKIVNWLVENDEFPESKAEALYERLWDEIANSEEIFDQIVYDIIEEMKDEEE